MTSWSEISRATIEKVAATIPEDTPLKERKAIISAAYPFGERSHWPYKAWCKARRAYLARYEPQGPAGPLFPNLPRDPITGRPIIA